MKQRKQRKGFAILLTIAMVIAMMPGAGIMQAFAADTVPPTGTYTIGSEEVTAYELFTADHLYWFADQVNSGSTTINAVLMNDIVVNTNVLDANGDLNSGSFTSWTPIGNETKMYDGKFDGQGHTISGLYVNKPSDGIHIGLFGVLNTQARIYRVGVVDSYFSGNGTIGGFCGSTSGDNGRATIQYCYTTATVKGESMVGGFCGYSNNALLYRCFSAGKVSGTNYVGPFFGGTQGDATRCYALTAEKGSFGGVGYKTADQFASGEVAYLLNYPDNGDASYWKQTIGTDSIPQYSGKIVYYGEGQYHNHTDDITHCLRCGAMETLNGVYQIKTKDQLYWFAALVNGTYGPTQNASAKAVLKADIAVDSDWTPIGNSTAFTGSFDGGNYTVSGLTNSLFGSIGSGANVSGFSVSGGGLCNANSGTIENCSVSGTGSVALCSGSNTGTIANCYAAGDSGTKLYSSSSGTVTNCYTLAGNTAAAVGGTALTTTFPFTRGEVAYLLNQGTSGHPGGVWGQDIGTDSLPLLGGETVYYNQNAEYHNHDGYCASCNIEPESDGTNGVYQISNVDELYWFANKVNSDSPAINAVLTADITVNTNVLDANGDLNRGNFKEWTPIGNGEYYMGNFDGQGHTISGLYVNAESTSRIGLFSALDTNSSVKNVNIADSYFKGYEYVGGVCGNNYKGVVSNCTNSGTVSGNDYIGGVCGAVSNGTVSNCTNSGAVSGNNNVGGVCGWNSSEYNGTDQVTVGTVSNCTNSGTVSGVNNNVGGVCGYNDAGVVSECTNSGTVSSSGGNVGGVCGLNKVYQESGTVSNRADTGTVSNCKNTGAVSGGFENVGGVCGKNDAGVVCECINSGAVSGSDWIVGGVCGNNDAGVVRECTNSGAVSGSGSDVGGVCGWNAFTSDINGCYNSGSVNGGSVVGGVCGRNQNSTIGNCYYDSDIYSGGAVGYNDSGTVGNDVLGKTTAQFTGGEVCYLLNGSSSENSIWHQNIDLADAIADAYPVLDNAHGIVYPCTGPCTAVLYSNTQGKTVAHSYKMFDDTYHQCAVCSDKQTHSTSTLLYTVVEGTSSIKVKCGDDCGKEYGTVTLSAPSGTLTYDGSVRTASVTDNVTGVTISEPDITYKKNGTELSSAPKDAGTYTASITLGTAMVSVEFTIASAASSISWGSNTSQTAAYTGNAIAPSKLTAPLVNGKTYSGKFQYSYRVKDSSDAFTSGLPTDRGSYEVKAKIAEGENYTAEETPETMILTVDWLATEAAAELTDQSNNTLTGDSWWAQSVTFTTPNEYTISNNLTGAYGTSYVYETQTGAAGTTVTYYLKNSDGEIAEKSATVRIDKTVPIWPENGGINIKENRWKELLSSISFGLLYKETVDVKVCANDSLSGVTAYCCYIDSTGGAMKTAEQLNALNFTEYAVEASTVSPVTVTSLSYDGNYVVYAYAVDKAGNKSAYVCTNGVVLDMTAPVISGIAAPSKDASTLTDTGAQISFTGSEAGTYFYIVKENGGTAPDSITDFATSSTNDKGMTTWTANEGVTSAAMTADAGNKILLSGLNANTTYTLYLAAVDPAGNSSAVHSQTFITCKTMPTITVNPTISGTYGQKVSGMTLTPGTTKVGNETISGTWELTDKNAADMPVVGTINTYVVTFKPADSQYETVTVQVTPAVEAKPITVTADNKSKTYGENNPDLTFTVPDGALAGSDTVTDLAVALTCTATASSPVTTEGYAITGTSTSTNYHVTVTPGTLTITRADAQITVGTTTYDKTFGDAAFSLDVTDTNMDEAVQYAVTTGADVVSVSDGTVTIRKAGTATITVSLPASTNYNAADSKKITVNVAKKTGYTVDTIHKTYAYKKGNTDTIDLSELLPSDCGSVTYGTPQVTGALYTEDGAPAVSDGKLSYTVTEGDTDKTGTITVTVSSENYADFTITVNVTLKGRIPVKIAAIGITDKTDSGANVYLGAIDEGEYGIDKYYLYYTIEPETNVTAETVKAKGTESPTGTFVLSGLPEDTTYYLYAIAVDTYGNASAVWADRFTTWVKAPEISPAGGSHVGSVSVSLSAGDGTTIYYTTDGSEPTTESTEYTQAFTLTASATVKAIAVKGNNGSVTTQAQFTIITGGLPTTPTDHVTQSGDSTTADLTDSTVSKGGETTTTVDQTTADRIVDKAVANNSEEVIIHAETKNSSASSSTKSAEVTLPAETLGAIAEKTDADVVIKTDVAEVKLDNKATEAIASQAQAEAGTTGNAETVSIIAEKVKEGAKEVRYELKVVTSSGKVISDFKGGSVSVTINVPKSLSNKKVVCVYIDDNGHMHKVEGKLNPDGTYTFHTGHFSQYALMEEGEAEEAIQAQKEAVKALKLTLRSSQVKTKSGKKAVKLTWKGGEDIRLDGIEIFRSLKRSSGYGKEPFYTTTKTSYLNTAVKKGTRYYYKVRGFATIDGEKVYTQYSTKAWRTVK